MIAVSFSHWNACGNTLKMPVPIDFTAYLASINGRVTQREASRKQDGARKYWKELSAERPEDDRLKKLAAD